MKVLELLIAAAMAGLPAVACAATAPAGQGEPAGPDRVERIAAMLPEAPAGFGRPMADRTAWQRLAAQRPYQDALRRAEGLLKEPLPPSPDDLYLDFSKTGNRSRWERVAGQRRGRVGYLTIAECLEDKGRFLPALAETVEALCAEKTWTMPAHDRSLACFHGKLVDVDLGAGHLAWDLAMARWLLGGKCPPKTAQLIQENLRRRVFEPYLAVAAGKGAGMWWVRTTNNWNAVCLACVTGAALATVEDRQERARFIAAAMDLSRNFLSGFTADGYCSEGVGYWGYGFGHYMLLSESIRQATGGRIDLLARPEVLAAATFPQRLEIGGGIWPAFADCSVGAKPSWTLTHFLARRFDLGADPADDARMIHATSSLGQAMMYSFPNAATRAVPNRRAAERLGIRSWFDKAGVLVCRPAADSACRMGVAMKGGHNDEHHNHNDVGSYVVVVGGVPVLLDPGAEVYTARTFSSRRYDSNVLNSFGHPVPRVAGQLQRTGRAAAGKVLRTDFTDVADTFALDLSACYVVPGLRKLHRTFSYRRDGAGSLTVMDEAAFEKPQEFETALITLGKWEQMGPNALRIRDGEAAVDVAIDAGAEYELKAEEIKEDVRMRALPTRIGIRLKQPAAEARIVIRITPAGGPAKAEGARP